MKITVFSQKKQITFEAERGDNLLRLFSAHSVHIPARCGGNGKCGKCKARLLSGKIAGTEPDERGEFLACLARADGDCSIAVTEEEGGGLQEFGFTRLPHCRGEEGYGVALDVGTTTLAACLVRLSDGRIVSRSSCLNPQAVFGSDVISRIQACAEKENLKELHRSVVDASARLVRTLTQGKMRIKRMTVAGNATMLHLFCGEDPSSIGVYPFRTVFTEEREYGADAFGLPCDRLILLPSVSAYVGADITADMLAADFSHSKENILLADIGTNGEMAILSGGKIVCASTAAGPALEGACIECGLGGVDGAIDRVYRQNGRLGYTVIGGETAKGICGCGLIDLVARLLEEGAIDETGYMEAEKYRLTDQVYLSQADVRQFQLAKSAIRAGMLALLRRAGRKEEEVDRLIIAGGLGYYIDPSSAAKTGLIPQALKDRAQALGNGSLYGAYLALTDEACREEARRLASRAETIDLSSDETFTEEFMEGMYFS